MESALRRTIALYDTGPGHGTIYTVNGSSIASVGHRYGDVFTGSKSGKKLAPLLGKLKDFDGGTSDIQIGILNNFLSYSDHVIGYRFIPRSLQLTDIEVIWMVREDAKDGRDYNLEDLTWLWHCTSKDDERIISLNQKGVNSNHYVPGPLSNMEWGIKAFHAGYLKQLDKKTNTNF